MVRPAVLYVLVSILLAPGAYAAGDTTPTYRLWAHGASSSAFDPCDGRTWKLYADVGGCALGEDLQHPPGAPLTSTFNAAGPDPDFACMAEMLTNGVNDLFTFHRTGGDISSSSSRREQYWNMGSPDLEGFLIDEIVVIGDPLDCADDRWQFGVHVQVWGQRDEGQPILAVSSDAHRVYPDTPVDLHVVVERADSATLEPGFGAIDPESASFPVLVSQETTFVLTATNAVATETKEITVIPRRPDVQLSVSAEEVFPGEPVTLQWSVAGATSVRVDPMAQAVASDGTLEVVPTGPETSYSVLACNSLGCTTSTVLVRWKVPEAQLWARPPVVYPGHETRLEWQIEGADTASLEPGIGPIAPEDGEQTLVPEGRTTYVLTATNVHGTTTREVLVVPRRPNVGLTASTTSPAPHEVTTLDVTIRGADRAWLEPMVGEIDPEDATFPFVFTEPTTVVLTAENAEGTESTTITVVPRPIADFRIEPEFVLPGDPVTLTWDVLPFAEVSMEPFGVLPPSGQKTFRPARSSAFEIHAEHPQVQESREITVFLGTEERSSVELHFDPTRLSPVEPTLMPGEPFTFYVTAVRPSPGVQAFEFELGYSPCLQVWERAVLIAGPIDVGLGDDNWVVGLGVCVVDPYFVPLVRYQMVAPDAECLEQSMVRVLPSTPSSFDPPTPGYRNCGNQLGLYEFEAFMIAPPLVLASVGGPLSVDPGEPDPIPDVPPATTRLLPSRPNPFNPRTTIRYQLAEPGAARLEILNAAGRRVRSVQFPVRAAGIHEWVWEGTADDGTSVGSGVYFLRLRTEQRVDTSRVVLLR